MTDEILMADDEHDILISLDDLMQREGFEVRLTLTVRSLPGQTG